MPAIEKVVSEKKKEYWDSLDPTDSKQVVEAVMAEVCWK
jgi:hypothetical protein